MLFRGTVHTVQTDNKKNMGWDLDFQFQFGLCQLHTPIECGSIFGMWIYLPGLVKDGTR